MVTISGGQSVSVSGSANEATFFKRTDASAAPGAKIGRLRWIAGTNPNTLKLVGAAGTSATEVTIVDNVGAGS